MSRLSSVVGKRYVVPALLVFTALLGAFHPPSSVADDGARIVKYGKEDVVAVHAKVRFSTLIVLPEDEEILDFTTGDREFWIINGSHNLCYVHPAQAGIRSNLNLITATGHVYSFLLTEISGEPTVQADLKLFVERKESSIPGIALRGYVRAADAEAYKKPFIPRRSSRSARHKRRRKRRSISSGRRMRRNLALTIRSMANLRANRFWFLRSITTTPSPTSVARPAKSPFCTRSRTASQISSRSSSRTAFTSFPKSSMRATSPWGRKS
jgi:hypothetical protein